MFCGDIDFTWFIPPDNNEVIGALDWGLYDSYVSYLTAISTLNIFSQPDRVVPAWDSNPHKAEAGELPSSSSVWEV